MLWLLIFFAVNITKGFGLAGTLSCFIAMFMAIKSDLALGEESWPLSKAQLAASAAMIAER